MAESSQFRYDINGLRAWAVVAVMLYHFKIPGFNGGFVGVDVFFVISGFLMAGVIQQGLTQQRFVLFSFYRARALRIVPALLLVCAATMAAGHLLLFDQEYIALAKQVTAAILFFSNHHFMAGGDYFAADAQEKLLLHTWSLAVEWQFYLVLPLIMLTAHRIHYSQRSQIISLLLFTLLSIICLCYLQRQQLNSFYPLLSRAWELLAGCLLFYAVQRVELSHSLRRVFEYTGFGLILYAVVSADSNSWPSSWSALPLLGCGLIIAAARSQSLLLNNSPCQYLGKWSYSLYLWHWPLCALLFMCIPQPSGWHKAAAIALAVILSALSYYALERPCARKNQHYWLKLLIIGCALLILLGWSYTVANKHFLKGRLAPQVLALTDSERHKNPYMRSCSLRELQTEEASQRFPCTFFRGEPQSGDIKPDLILLGDSHAASIANLVSTINGGIYVKSYAAYACPPIIGFSRSDSGYNCTAQLPKVLAEIRSTYQHVPVLVYSRYAFYLHGPNENNVRQYNRSLLQSFEQQQFGSATYRRQLLAGISNSLCKIAMNNPVTVIAPTPELGFDFSKLIARDLILKRPQARYGISQSAHLARSSEIIEQLYYAQQQCGIAVFDPLPYLCEHGFCSAIDGNKIRYFDDDHISQHGTQLFLAPLTEHLNTHYRQQLHNKSAP